MENNKISVKRLITTGSKEAYASIYTYENIDCYIEKQDPKVAIMYGDENAFNTFLCVINQILDIRKSDLIIDQNSNQYRVSGFQKFDNPEIESHIELIMQQKNADTN